MEKDSSVPDNLAVAPVRIVVVDDHSVVREGLTVLLGHIDGMRIVGSVASAEEAVLAAHRLRPDVIIMDLVLPVLSGLEATRRIVSELPQIRIIALSGCHTLKQVGRALRAGARGYVLKTASSYELLSAIRDVMSDRQYVSPGIGGLPTAAGLASSIPASPFETLSTRERAVLQHIMGGATSADIALQLSLSRKTVDTYRSRVMLKLGVANRSELIRLALEYELPTA